MIIKIFQPIHEVLTAILFQYETPRIVTIRNIKIGLFHRFLQLAIVGYVLGYKEKVQYFISIDFSDLFIISDMRSYTKKDIKKKILD